MFGGTTLKSSVKAMVEGTISNPLQKCFNWEGKTCWKTKDAFVKRGFKTSNLCHTITGEIYILVRGKMFVRPLLDVCAGNVRKTCVSYLMKEVLARVSPFVSERSREVVAVL